MTKPVLALIYRVAAINWTSAGVRAPEKERYSCRDGLIPNVGRFSRQSQSLSRRGRRLILCRCRAITGLNKAGRRCQFPIELCGIYPAWVRVLTRPDRAPLQPLLCVHRSCTCDKDRAEP